MTVVYKRIVPFHTVHICDLRYPRQSLTQISELGNCGTTGARCWFDLSRLRWVSWRLLPRRLLLSWGPSVVLQSESLSESLSGSLSESLSESRSYHCTAHALDRWSVHTVPLLPYLSILALFRPLKTASATRGGLSALFADHGHGCKAVLG